MSDGRVSNVRMGHAGGINFQPFLPAHAVLGPGDHTPLLLLLPAQGMS